LEAQEELVFAQENIQAYNGQPIWFSPCTTREMGQEFACGLWYPTELELSSTRRELKAAAMTYHSFADQLKFMLLNGSQTVKTLFGLYQVVVENPT